MYGVMEPLLVYGFISSRLDYYNVLLFGLPHCLLQSLQFVHNAAVKLKAQKRKYDHVRDSYQNSHARVTSFEQRINFNVLIGASLQGPIQLVPSTLIRTDHTLQIYKRFEII